jgi:hypothetical protein
MILVILVRHAHVPHSTNSMHSSGCMTQYFQPCHAFTDSLRPFILHSYGGVYLDMDTECFANMEPWVDGAQLVLSAEVRGQQLHVHVRLIFCWVNHSAGMLAS